MKHKLIETEKARVLIVDLPAGVKNVILEFDEETKWPWISYVLNGTGHNIPLYCKEPINPGTWLPAGKLGEVPEEVAELIVESSYSVCRNPGIQYKNYFPENNGGPGFSIARWSLESLVRANVNLRNPLGDKPPKASCLIGGMELLVRDSFSNQLNRSRHQAWQAEEETVFKKPFLFYESKEKK
ncbi:hypothetical protein [Niabella aurantiaca]|uniref:hypothetical protein n=1 Tax=Niabella aurantiaca TaxID=379900 RepID=UPI00035DE6F4|nr:hypothetical protein [Niabella aurantiaca]